MSHAFKIKKKIIEIIEIIGIADRNQLNKLLFRMRIEIFLFKYEKHV